ncbi:PQQ-binding-like beta-propeller repeat protein [Streptomyces sp. NPDC001792]|uniref:PQQ-binding-like beta-propeller repeat protein n=1 Tax=Streptomyces sp. NPDC001792 TaxID=3154524 RepID=UPI0033205665
MGFGDVRKQVDAAGVVGDARGGHPDGQQQAEGVDADVAFAERWTRTSLVAVDSSPAVVDGTVYVGSNVGIGKNDPTLFAVDAATGAGPVS